MHNGRLDADLGGSGHRIGDCRPQPIADRLWHGQPVELATVSVLLWWLDNELRWAAELSESAVAWLAPAGMPFGSGVFLNSTYLFYGLFYCLPLGDHHRLRALYRAARAPSAR